MNKGGFIRKKVETLSLGERLTKWREERHLQISDVSRNTGIQATYVEYLEQEAFDKLPAEVYVRGFLRRYAEFLGVPEGPVLRQYERERGMNRSLGNTHEEEDSMQRSAFRNIPAAIITPARMTFAAFALLVVGAFAYVYVQYRTFVSEPTLSVFEPAEEATRTMNRSLPVSGKTDPDSRVFINDQPVLVDEAGAFRETVDVQKGMNTVTVRSVSRFGKETRRTFSIDGDIQEETTAPETTLPSTETPEYSISVRVGKNPVWILVTVDGEQKVSEVAKPESKWSFSPKASMTLSVGDGSDIYVTMGTKGKETALSDKAGVAEYEWDKKKESFVVKQ